MKFNIVEPEQKELSNSTFSELIIGDMFFSWFWNAT